MNNKHIAVLAGLFVAVAAAPAAMAADSFSGFYVSGGIGQKSANVEEGVSNAGAAASIKLGDNSFVGQFAGGYSFALDGGIRLGLGGFIDLGDGKAGGGSLSIAGLNGTYAAKETRHYGISIEPGFAFTKDTVGYVKLMYNWIKGEETLSGASTGSASNTFSAFGYGLGVKTIVSNNVYIFGEWQQSQYNTASFASGAATVTYKPNESLGLVGVGIHF